MEDKLENLSRWIRSRVLNQKPVELLRKHPQLWLPVMLGGVVQYLLVLLRIQVYHWVRLFVDWAWRGHSVLGSDTGPTLDYAENLRITLMLIAPINLIFLALKLAVLFSSFLITVWMMRNAGQWKDWRAALWVPVDERKGILRMMFYTVVYLASVSTSVLVMFSIWGDSKINFQITGIAILLIGLILEALFLWLVMPRFLQLIQLEGGAELSAEAVLKARKLALVFLLPWEILNYCLPKMVQALIDHAHNPVDIPNFVYGISFTLISLLPYIPLMVMLTHLVDEAAPVESMVVDMPVDAEQGRDI